MDTAMEFFIDVSADSQLNKLKEEKSGVPLGEDDFAQAFDRSQELLGRRLRFRSFYWMVGQRALLKEVKIMHKFVDGMLQKHHEEQEKGWSSGKYDFISALATREHDGETIRDQVLGLLIAGRDTTGSQLSWLFAELIRHPEIFAKLRAVVLETFGPCEAPNISFTSLKNCQYLQHCLNETLRLHPVVPFNSRFSVKDTTLPVGGGPDGKSPVFVPKGTEVNYATHVMHLRKDLWGPDAHEFKPDRWAAKKPGIWHYLPFNGGPRVCLGQQFALTEVGYITVRMLQRFDGIQGLVSDPNLYHHFIRLACQPGPGKAGVKVKLHVADC